ncbi:MAG: ATP-dependent DNA helicase RecQ [Candidatus Magasanikbacteria bacterium RIFCSPHIGHO2_02_FULL_51_14]|uniref:DNA helicase RecQ n=1 Tax=Candidatus Magasanikbacteria bacterium RIFCSPHIGHO2_02_FULL_51_14 TaxID=1798683 RepID=A0A1F6MR41_9BACT|nr:MAG: ATP-dependent DNA helicase RecQ [Candidatus Magasanikbacteria bacterium RIFCSPHIGHO2_02_FULL_51_14]
MLQLLKTHFGYDAFRPLQEDIIKTVLAKKDCFVLMPTGGGKSLCYQLPAVQFDGLTLVVSPLIALMKDQVDALKANGIAAEFVNSSLPRSDIARICQEASAGRVKMLYLAPERLAISEFRNFLRGIRVSLIAIDEAHCISEWGHDFRPDYRNLKTLRDDFPHVPVIALTATATERVRADILDQLRMNGARQFLASFNRPNLTYYVEPKTDGFSQLVAFLEKHKGESAIIYCFSRKNTEELALDVQAEGFSALPYHAGLEPALRKKTQEQFIRDEVPIIVATIAFGMGIDKPDVRLIVHYHLPKTIEGYYQETGRAGRDGLPSDCVLLYSAGDVRKHYFFIDQIEDDAERRNAQVKLSRVIDFCELSECRRKCLLAYFGERQKEDNCASCDVCASPREEFDGTVIAQKILSAILRTGERFGAAHVIGVLRGSRRRQILASGHETLSVYGIAPEYSRPGLGGIIKQLTNMGLVLQEGGQYPTLRVTNSGKKFLRDREKIVLQKPRTETAIRLADDANAMEFDRELFEHLRRLRKEIADENSVPPFVIFGDASLQEMAAYVPQSAENFARVFGVGAEKLARFGPRFVEAIGSYAREHHLEERPIPARRLRSAKDRTVAREGSTFDDTRALLERKFSLEDIARERALSYGTALAHAEKLHAAGRLPDISHLKPPEDRLLRIKDAFANADTAYLSPVKDILGEDFSYDEIRLARLFLSLTDNG